MMSRLSPQKSEIPKGCVPIGTLRTYRISSISIDKSKIQSEKPSVAYVGNDESGNMGPDQGDAYVIVGTVVSDWELFAQTAKKTDKGRFKKGHSLTEEEFEGFFEDVRELIESIHVVAIRKDITTPSKRVQHNIHIGGLASVAANIMRTDNSDHIEATIDYSDQVMPKGLDRKLYELNPYGKDAKASTINAKLNAGLSAHDYVVYSVANWFARGNYNLVEMIDNRLHYTITDYKTMELVGGRVNLELNTGITYRPINGLSWSDIDLSTDRLGSDTFIVGRTNDYEKTKNPKSESRKRTANRPSSNKSKGGKR